MKIVVNGHEYSSPNELPADARAGYERALAALGDKNGNGIPDILEMQLDPAKLNAAWSAASPGTTVITGQKFVINGREYDNVEQMSPEDRQQYDAVQSLLAGGSQPLDSKLPPVRRSLDPLNPAEWTPNRGLVATDTLTILFVGMLIGALVICGIFVVMGGLRWLLPG